MAIEKSHLISIIPNYLPPLSCPPLLSGYTTACLILFLVPCTQYFLNEWMTSMLLTWQIHIYLIRKSFSGITKCNCNWHIGEYLQMLKWKNWQPNLEIIKSQMALSAQDPYLQTCKDPYENYFLIWNYMKLFFCHLQSQRLQESLKKVNHIKILVQYIIWSVSYSQ